MRMRYSVWLVVVLTLTACAPPTLTGSLSPEEASTSFWQHFPNRVVPRSPAMDPYLATLNQSGDAGTQALYMDAKTQTAVNLCIAPTGTDDCEPPLDQDRRMLTELEGHSLYVFSGPNGSGFDSWLAGSAETADWTVVSAP